MFLKKLSFLLTIFYIFSSVIVPQANAAWNVWIDHSIIKIKQNGYDHANVEKKSGSQSLTVKMAKNEFESFQIFIYADGEDLSDVDVVVGIPTKGSDTISDVYLYKEWYISTSASNGVSRPEYTPGYYPDALLPKVDRYYGETRNTFPFSITNGNVQGVWVDLGTIAAQAAGTYTSTVTVSASGKSDLTLNLTVEVWDFALPATPTFTGLLGVVDGWISLGHMNVAYDANTIDRLMPLYAKMFQYHRTSIQTNSRNITSYDWDSGTDILSNVDFTIFDGYYTDVMDGTAITSGPYAGAKNRTLWIPSSWTNSGGIINTDSRIANEDKSSATTQYYQAWYDHVGAKGWDPANTLAIEGVQEPSAAKTMTWRGETKNYDEIVPLMVADANAIDTSVYGTGADFQRMQIASHNRSEFDGVNCLFTPWVGTYAPPAWEKTNASSSNIYPASGYPSTMERQWVYMSCMSNGCNYTGSQNPDLNGQVDLSMEADPMYNRLFSFVFQKHGVTDFYYFQANGTFAYDPYDEIWVGHVEGSNGDGTLVYPGVAGEFGGTPSGAHTPNIGGTHDIPIESIRLKYVRDAMEDMEYFKLAVDGGHVASVNNYVDSMFTNTQIALSYWNLNMNPNALLSARSGIGNLITGNTQVPLSITIAPPEIN